MKYLIEDISIKENTVTIKADAYFTENFLSENFFVEYEDRDIVNQEEQIIIAPFLLNVAPIIWLSGCSYKLKYCNKELYEGLVLAQKLMKEQYPDYSWDGEIVVENIVTLENKAIENNHIAVLFSGGLDSITTSLRHKDRKQLLLAVQGADIGLENTFGWEQLKKNNNDYAQQFGFEVGFIRSNVQQFVNVAKLQDKVIYNWWGGVQHGLGLCGLSLPIIINKGISNVFIGSSFTDSFYKPWGSTPQIDNSTKLGLFSSVHDGFEWTRQQKLSFVVECQKNSSTKTILRVCHSKPNFGKGNCGKCEKCLRTMIGLIVEGEDIELWGFPVEKEKVFQRIKKSINNTTLKFSDVQCFFWMDIRNKAIQAPSSLKQSNFIFYQWFTNVDFEGYLARYLTMKPKKTNKSQQLIFNFIKNIVEKIPLLKRTIIFLLGR